jgi:large subunit ribosomal protein L21
MYAVIHAGGKQYRVSSGEKFRIELMPAAIGESVSFDQVLAVGQGDSLRVGAPYVAGVSVKGTVLGHGRGDKVMVFKMRRRKGYRRTQGHRQAYTEVLIDDIVG